MGPEFASDFEEDDDIEDFEDSEIFDEDEDFAGIGNMDDEEMQNLGKL